MKPRSGRPFWPEWNEVELAGELEPKRPRHLPPEGKRPVRQEHPEERIPVDDPGVKE